MELAEQTDGQLLDLARRGNYEAFGCLVDRHKNPIVNYLTRLTGNRERAEDFAQETFVRLYENRDRYIDQGKMASYLYRIAGNLVRSEARRAKRWNLLRPILQSTNGTTHHEPSQHARVVRSEIGARLQEALSQLPLKYRMPIVLAEVEEWSYRDIAEFLGCREGTVKSRIHRGKRMLREQLAPLWNGSHA